MDVIGRVLAAIERMNPVDDLMSKVAAWPTVSLITRGLLLARLR